MPLPETLLKHKAPLRLKYMAYLQKQLPGGSSTVTVSGFPPYAQYQILSMWCWNAVGSAVSTYYLTGGVGNAGIQCNNATTYLTGGSGKCCSINVPGHGSISGWIPTMQSTGAPIHYNPGNVSCNQGGWPQWVANGTGSLSSNQVNYSGTSGPNSSQVQQIVTSLTNSQPVVMLIWWNGGGGHVVTIYGSYTSGSTRYYNVADPWDGYHQGWTGAPSGGYWGGSIFIVPNTGTS